MHEEQLHGRHYLRLADREHGVHKVADDGPGVAAKAALLRVRARGESGDSAREGEQEYVEASLRWSEIKG